ncbi:MAG: hypothetical protein J0H59_02640 [Comamonadaceae bacterium]|nr:hypothetical protein [Comamonadaceae bacterium]
MADDALGSGGIAIGNDPGSSDVALPFIVIVGVAYFLCDIGHCNRTIGIVSGDQCIRTAQHDGCRAFALKLPFVGFSRIRSVVSHAAIDFVAHVTVLGLFGGQESRCVPPQFDVAGLDTAAAFRGHQIASNGRIKRIGTFSSIGRWHLG